MGCTRNQGRAFFVFLLAFAVVFSTPVLGQGTYECLGEGGDVAISSPEGDSPEACVDNEQCESGYSPDYWSDCEYRLEEWGVTCQGVKGAGTNPVECALDSCSYQGDPCSSNDDCCSSEDLVCDADTNTCGDTGRFAEITDPADESTQNEGFSITAVYHADGGIQECEWRVYNINRGTTVRTWTDLGCSGEDDTKTPQVLASWCSAGEECRVFVRTRDALGDYSTEYDRDYHIAGCGDGVCGGGEDCSSCSADCGSCVTCGDGVVDAGEEVLEGLE